MKITRLCKDNYDELIQLLDNVFSKKNNKEHSFEKDLPKMCVRDDAHMNKHFGIFEDDKLCSVLGVYPLPTTIDGQDFMFATMGNIATLPEHCGKGYMSS